MTADQEDSENQQERNQQIEDNSNEREPTPLPKVQLFIALLVQFAEPVTGLVIYPFINQLVRDTGINQGDETTTGYYAGLIESAFFLAECLCVVQWGYLSDRIGRRPVLLIGPLGLAVSATLFGLSSTFPMLILFRCIQGIFNGNIGVARSVIAEITDDTNVGAAYAYNPLMWSTGVTVAPFLGGVLSKPAERWPNTFGRIELFRTHPYFLPCASGAFIAFCTFLVALFGLKESLPSAVRERTAQESLSSDAEDASTAPLLGSSSSTTYGTADESIPYTGDQVETEASVQVPPSSALLHYRPLLIIYFNYIFLVFCDMSSSVLLPLMYSTPIEYGGLGLQPFHIGTALGSFGLVNSLFQSQVFGRLVRRFGSVRLYQLGFASVALSFLIYPLASFFAKRAGHVDAAVVACIVVHFSLIAMIYFAYGTILVLIAQSLPEGGMLGMANGIGQMLSSGMRTIAPTIASSLFSVTKQRNLVGGNLCFYLLFGLCLVGARASLLLVDPATLKKEKRARDSSGGVN